MKSWEELSPVSGCFLSPGGRLPSGEAVFLLLPHTMQHGLKSGIVQPKSELSYRYPVFAVIMLAPPVSFDHVVLLPVADFD